MRDNHQKNEHFAFLDQFKQKYPDIELNTK